MDFTSNKFKLSLLAWAAQAALLAMAVGVASAYAEEEMNDEVKELVMPTNTVELGVIGLTGATDKSGEYNGLNHSGGVINGGFKLRGGDAYGMGSGTNRWSIEGRDLGTASRSLDAQFSDQGNWSLGFGQDSLRHYTTNGDFKTPFTGSLGGNVFRWGGTPLNAGTTATGPVFNGGAALTESSFLNESVYTDRKTNSFTAGYIYDRSLSFKFEAKRLEQTGAKLASASSDMTLLQALNSSSASPGTTNTNYFKGQGIVTLLSPTNYTTDTFDLGVAWTGDKGHVNASYFASVFRDGYSGLSWDNPYFVSTNSGNQPGAGTNTSSQYLATGGMMNSMGTAPSNDFHQLNLSGGYKFTSATKFAGSLSYGRNTQNQGYSGSYTNALGAGQRAVTGMPFNSLNGVVNTTNATGRLTHQLNKSLELAAGFRFNERDNRTASGLYEFTNLGGYWRTSATTAYNQPRGTKFSEVVNGNITTTVWDARGALVAASPIGSLNPANTENYLSIPMSTRRQVLDFSADYKFDSSRKLRFTYEDDRLSRWCKVDPTSNATLASDAEGSYSLSHNCAEVPTQNERRAGLNFRQNLGDGSGWSVAYLNSDRRSSVNSNYYNPGTAGMQATTSTTYANSTTTIGGVATPTVTQTTTTNPYGVVVPGYIAFFQASRKQDLLRAAYNWQASESLDVGMRARYGHDSYYDSTFGVQNGRTVGLDFDANWTYSSRHAFAAFFSTQDMRRDMRLDTSTNITDAATTTVYGNTLKNQDRTIGLSATQTGYFDGKWAFNERVTYSNSTSGYSRSTISGAALSLTGNLGNSDTVPEIKYETTQLRLGAVYTLTKEDRVLFNYAYQKLRSNDYYFNLYSGVSAVGSNTVMPTFQQSPTYQAQMLALVYSHSFR